MKNRSVPEPDCPSFEEGAREFGLGKWDSFFISLFPWHDCDLSEQ